MNRNPWLAMVALEDEQLPATNDLAQFLRSRWPEEPEIAEVSQKGNVVTFRVGKAAAALTLIPLPIAAPYLTGPCACAWYWPEAAEEMENHQAHIMVMLLDETHDAVGKSMLLTRLVAAIADQSNSLGIFWGPAHLVHSPKALLDTCQEMSRDNMPLYLWIDFRIEREDDGRLRLFTTGLEAFGHQELEVTGYEGQVVSLREAVYNVAHYILEGKKRVEDGHVMGLADQTEITVRHLPSMLDESKPVTRLEF